MKHATRPPADIARPTAVLTCGTFLSLPAGAVVFAGLFWAYETWKASR